VRRGGEPYEERSGGFWNSMKEKAFISDVVSWSRDLDGIYGKSGVPRNRLLHAFVNICGATIEPLGAKSEKGHSLCILIPHRHEITRLKMASCTRNQVMRILAFSARTDKL
jgi:hypothetical protein